MEEEPAAKAAESLPTFGLQLQGGDSFQSQTVNQIEKERELTNTRRGAAAALPPVPSRPEPRDTGAHGARLDPSIRPPPLERTPPPAPFTTSPPVASLRPPWLDSRDRLRRRCPEATTAHQAFELGLRLTRSLVQANICCSKAQRVVAQAAQNYVARAINSTTH